MEQFKIRSEEKSLKYKSSVRALQAWLILIGQARNRQIITYGQLADIMGFPGALPTIDIVTFIAAFCISQKDTIPPLTAIVVNQKTGLPGEGYPWDFDKISEYQQKVFRYDWYSLIPPTFKEFEEAYDMVKENDWLISPDN